MIAQVLPLIKLPRHLTIFDYQVPPYLVVKKYSLVIVPWRNKKVFALVFRLKNKSVFAENIKLKKIEQVLLAGQPVAIESQATLISRFSEKFLLPQNFWWKSILPNLKKNDKFLFTFANSVQNKLVPISKKIKISLPRATPEMLNELLLDIKQIEKQLLILVPEIDDIEKIYKLIPRQLLDQTVLYYKKLSRRQLNENYFKVLSNQAKIIIGTKTAVLLPFAHLKNIFIYKSEAYGFFSGDQNPRYSLDKILSDLLQIYPTSLKIFSLAPNLETFAWVKKNQGLINLKQRPLDFKLINMALENKENKNSQISWVLEQEIISTLQSGKKCLLLLDKKDDKKNIICRDCGWMPTCVSCGRILPDNNNLLICPTCGLKSILPNLCPQCQGVNIQNFGINIGLLKNNLNKIFPQIKISINEKNKPLIDPQAKIIIATKYILSKIDENFGLIAFVCADQVLFNYHYRSHELAWQYFNNTFRTIINATKIVQTFKIDDLFWQNLSQETYQTFWQKEMNWRRLANYPPYLRIVKLIYKHKEKKQIQIFQQKIEKNCTDLETLKLIAVKINKSTGNFVIQSAILYKNNQVIFDLLSKLPESTKIEFNPYEI